MPNGARGTRCTCPRIFDVVGPMVRAYRKTSRGRAPRWITSRKITHYGPGDQVAWHWVDRRVTFNTWYRWLPSANADGS